MCFVVICWERADLLALVCGVFCEFVTFLLVSWVRCGTWLYRFLIFAPLLTFKIFVSRSFVLIEEHLECEKHAVVLGCLDKTLFNRVGCDAFAKWRNLKSEQLSSTSVRKKCITRKFMKTWWKPLGRSLLITQCKNGHRSLRGGGRLLSMMNSLAAQSCHLWWKCQVRAHAD